MGDQDSLQLAVSAIRDGRRGEARRLLARILQGNPRDEHACLWMSTVADTDQQRIDCLRHVLAINPDNARAGRVLAELRGDSGASGTTYASRLEPEPSPKPVPDEATPDHAPDSEEVPPERRLSLALTALSGLLLLVVCGLLLAACVAFGLSHLTLLNQMLGIGSPPTFTKLEWYPIDAEYSLALDRIVFVSHMPSPFRLHVYDPSSHADVTIDLPWEPRGVSVAPDGRFAAVGYDGHISYIDLETLEVVKVFDVGIRMYDVILASNGWIFALPRLPTDELRAVHIEKETEVVITGGHSWPDTAYKLHPDGQSLYRVTKGHPLEKIDSSGDVPVYARDYPYADTHPTWGNLWFSEDGQRVFTSFGQMFHAPSNRDENLTSAGRLANLEGIQDLTHSSSAGLVLAIPSGAYRHEEEGIAENHVVLLEDQHLDIERVVTIPDFVVDGKVRTTEGRHVFANAAGTQYYIIAGILMNGGYGPAGLIVGDLPPESSRTSTAMHPATDQPEHTPSATIEGAITQLSFSVVDAEYSLGLDRMVMVSDDPPRLHIYAAAAQSDITVDLSSTPTSVSVGPGDRFAAVGHDRLISYVDLQDAQVIKTVGLGSYVYDVVLARNGWIYASSRGGEYADVLAVRVSPEGVEHQRRPALHPYTLHKLHPGAESLYGAAPSHIEKADVSNGMPDYAYRSPFLADHPACADLWLSEDGQRIFTACGHVFRASPERKQDMTYIGSLPGLERILHLTDSSSAGRVVAIRARGWYDENQCPDTNELLIFSRDQLHLESIVALPNFPANGGLYAANGRFVFMNAAGTHYYVIVQADAASGLVYDFGVFTGEF
jgi:hypothetical protein